MEAISSLTINRYTLNLLLPIHSTQLGIPNMSDILLLNGPNLNLLGTREPEIYGATTLPQLVEQCEQRAAAANLSISHLQSNHEGELVDRIHQAKEDGVKFIIINPAAFTHTSVALRDALAGVDIPFIELHISNVHGRESFRQHSYLSDKAVGVICGLGTFGYSLAIDAAANQLKG